MGIVAASTWLWPSSCCRPSPLSVVRPAVPPIRKPRARRVARRPGEVADPLEAEHRVERVEGDHLAVVVRVGGRRRDPGGERARLVDPLLQDLPLAVLAVEHQLVGVLGLVELADVGVDAELAEHPLHPEGARLVGDDRDDPRADLLVAQERGQHPHEGHRGRDLALAGALELRGEGLQRRHRQRRRRPCAGAGAGGRRAAHGAPSGSGSPPSPRPGGSSRSTRPARRRSRGRSGRGRRAAPPGSSSSAGG